MIPPEDEELRCALADEGGCWGTAYNTLWCAGHGHKVLGNLCAHHTTKMNVAAKQMSCGKCAADGHRCQVSVSYDHELDTWRDKHPVFSESVPLYQWKFASPKTAAWWGKNDGRADYPRFPGGLSDTDEIEAFLNLLGENPALEEKRRRELVTAYTNAHARGFEWLNAALPYTIGHACECGCDGRDHAVIWDVLDSSGTLTARGRARCTKCSQCQEFRRAPQARNCDSQQVLETHAAASGSGEFGGDSPYQAAVGALGAYVQSADILRGQTEVLEASLTMHGFDRDEALMAHIIVLQEVASQLESQVTRARATLFSHHAVGGEYHASGKDAAASAFRSDAGSPP